MARTFKVGPPLHLWTPFTPEQVQDVLDTDSHGTVTEATFDIRLPARGRSAFKPQLVGFYHSASDGTFIEVQRVLPSGQLVGVVIAIVLLGPLMTVFLLFFLYAAWQQSQEQVEALLDRLTVVARGDEALRLGQVEVADPTTDGAAAAAPRSFAARADFDRARFHVRQPDGTLVVLEVSLRGVSVLRPNQAASVHSWEALDRIGIEGSRLGLSTGTETSTVDLGEHPEDDRRWLVTYLNDRDRRWSASAADRDAAERDRRRLQSIREQSS